MYGNIVLTISILSAIDCFYLEAASNYLKPRLERNNIVNKGIWVRNKLQDDLFEKKNLGNFIFRPNSADADHLMQSNFDRFAENNNLQEQAPFVSSYVQRIRRSPEHIRKRRPRKNMKQENSVKQSIEDSVIIKSKILSDIKPTSVFNEYPYEVAILLNSDGHVQTSSHKREMNTEVTDTTSKGGSANDTDGIKEELEVIPLNSNVTVSTDAPRRSKKYDVRYDFDNKEINNYNMVDDNDTEVVIAESKQNRDALIKGKTINWNIRPRLESNIYKVTPKEPSQPKSVTERGLIKIISMLTKSFKKIMKQHIEIKDIHEKLMNVNQNFDNKLTELSSKFDDFDSKYTDMIQFNNKIKTIESDINSEKHHFDIKHQEIKDSFAEFQDQQKKFVDQQKQFYAIQKLMLAQNEKINAKQNAIAKIQSQISHKQNNFARILKKAKQILKEEKEKLTDNDRDYKENANPAKNQDYSVNHDRTTTPATVPITTNTQAMKINLFSIQTKSKLENQDAMIIKEKDNKQIDDLIYKYYFNNTFIDSLMKSKILNNYASTLNSVEIVKQNRQIKNKRDKLETTIMVPIISNFNDTPAKRDRRWINHFNKNRYKANRGTKESKQYKAKTEDAKHKNKAKEDENVNEVKDVDKVKKDPFLTMASNFCNEIGQNANEQVLKWCVEKALRRLKFMEMNAFSLPTTVMMEKKSDQKQSEVHQDGISTLSTVSAAPVMPTAVTDIREPVTYGSVSAKVTPMFPVSRISSSDGDKIYFPDNDELESNLKQYELKPDTEGNVYYDGSVHISDYGHMIPDSGATSDIMPGLMDSNSKVEIDPMTFDIQAKRRAYVRRLNESIMKQMRDRKTQ